MPPPGNCIRRCHDPNASAGHDPAAGLARPSRSPPEWIESRGAIVMAGIMNAPSFRTLLPIRGLQRFTLDPTDLLRDAVYRRLWLSILISSFGGQVTLLALPLSAAVLLHASPTQMGILTAVEIVPFALFSLPTGVWLDRVRKLPIYIIGELSLSVTVASVPLAWWLGWLAV